MYYFMILAASFFFSLQFLFQQHFQKNRKKTWPAALMFSFYSSAAAFVILLLLGRFHLSFSPFAFSIAFAYALAGILYNYACIRVLGNISLSVFSTFAMLGGMLLPSAFGILFYAEAFTLSKLAGCSLIAAALLLAAKASPGVRRTTAGTLWCLAVFVLNGMSGVLSKLHQSNPGHGVDSISFMALTQLLMLCICGVLNFHLYLKNHSLCGQEIFLQARISSPENSALTDAGGRRTALFCSIGYAFFYSVGNLFLLTALKHLPASVQYPVTTSAVILFSSLLSLLQHEKLTLYNAAASILTFTAAAIIMLP